MTRAVCMILSFLACGVFAEEADLLAPEDRDYRTLKVIEDSKDGKAVIQTESGKIEITADVKNPELPAKREYDRTNKNRDKKDDNSSKERDVSFSAKWSWGD